MINNIKRSISRVLAETVADWYNYADRINVYDVRYKFIKPNEFWAYEVYNTKTLEVVYKNY